MKAKVYPDKRKTLDILLTLLAISFMSTYYYGTRVIIMLIIAIVSSVIIDSICFKLSGFKNRDKFDFSYIITGVIITLLLPASAPYWLIVVGVFIAIAVVKYPFGGFGNNIFNPTAVSLAFMGLCWPSLLFMYPEAMTKVSLASTVTQKLVYSPLYVLQNGGTPSIRLIDIITGAYAGPMGATAIMVICAAGLYLLVRRTISFQMPAVFMITMSIFSVILPRVMTGTKASLLFETVVGVGLFGIIFMASDPTTSPVTGLGKGLYGFFLGIVAILFRYYGVNEYAFLYALVIMNVFASSCDTLGEILKNKFSKPM